MSFSSGLKIHFLLYFFIFYRLTCAFDNWKIKEVTNNISVLSVNNLQYLCNLSNESQFKDLLNPILVERIVGSESHVQVEKYLEDIVSQYGFTPEWDTFTANTPVGPKIFRNLIATFAPWTSRRIVMACHYDSKIFLGKIFVAATDAAVPCAMLLEVARTLGPLLHKKTKNNTTLQLLFLDGEEAFVDWTSTDSLYGARHLADIWEKQPYSRYANEIDRILSSFKN